MISRDADGIIQIKYANAGDVGLGGLDLNNLWEIAYSTPGGSLPQREQFNQLYRYLSAMAVELNQKGPFLGYSALIDYLIGAVVIGSDDIEYRCLIANGPSTAAVDPVGDVSGTWGSFGDSLNIEVGKFVNEARFVTGSVLTGTTLIPKDNTVPQNTEGDQYMTLAYTPDDAANILYVTSDWYGTSGASENNMILALFRDGVVGALALGSQTVTVAGSQMVGMRLSYRVVAGSISPTTFNVRAGGNIAATTTFNGSLSAALYNGVLSSNITIKEYLP